ncbi:MAG: ABC transporter ATP-binding protein [Phycisphaerales bacterium JB065]
MTLRCEKLGFTYRGTSRPVLQDITLHFNNPVTAIIGPNGAGKSTLLRLLGALEDRGQTKGHVFIEDSKLETVPVPDRVRRIAFLSQTPRLSAPLSVRQSVALGRVLLSPDDEAVDRALNAVGLLARANDRFGTLSIGQRQLAAFARTMAQLSGPRAESPRYLLADEPVAALDPSHAIRLAKLIRNGAESGIRCIMVVHDLGFAAAVADRVVFLAEGGSLLLDGPPDEMFTSERLGKLFGCGFREPSGTLHPDYGA